MLEFPKWKVWLISLLIAFGVMLSIPSLIERTSLASHWPKWLPNYKISLGLDLAGGSHLLFEADMADAQKQRLAQIEDEVTTELRRDPRIDIGDISTAGGRLSFLVRDPTHVDDAVERLRKLATPIGLTGTREWDIQVMDSTRIVMIPTPAGTAKALKDAMAVARDVVRKRIDPSGTKEITVITEGGNRIMVEVPGVEDPEALKRLVGQTARLDFKLVDLSANPQEVQQGHAPPGAEVLPLADGTGYVAVQHRVMVSGTQIIRAQQSYDQDGKPDIEIGFNTAGAKRFGRVTQENVGKPFAIILDGRVLSAPVINEPILGGNAVINGNFTVQSANDLAISLASGKLPVKLVPIEERTVSAELGQDSINKGAIASIVSVIGVIIFMLVTYGRFGVYANIALVVNAFLILGIMAMFNATLTLPGIAGFILTIGAAVDANVLINERIREEIRRGRRLLDAVETGYHEAFRAIFDYFGSGPVRGFAVVLLIGVVTSVFTAVYFTRMLVALWIRHTRPRALHI